VIGLNFLTRVFVGTASFQVMMLTSAH
jgi:hypothetical protein